MTFWLSGHLEPAHFFLFTPGLWKGKRESGEDDLGSVSLSRTPVKRTEKNSHSFLPSSMGCPAFRVQSLEQCCRVEYWS